MAIDLVGLAKEASKKERTEKLVKEFRNKRSQLLGAEKEQENLTKKIEGLKKELSKIEKEAEDELGEEWHDEPVPEVQGG